MSTSEKQNLGQDLSIFNLVTVHCICSRSCAETRRVLILHTHYYRRRRCRAQIVEHILLFEQPQTYTILHNACVDVYVICLVISLLAYGHIFIKLMVRESRANI